MKVTALIITDWSERKMRRLSFFKNESGTGDRSALSLHPTGDKVPTTLLSAYIDVIMQSPRVVGRGSGVVLQQHFYLHDQCLTSVECSCQFMLCNDLGRASCRTVSEKIDVDFY